MPTQQALPIQPPLNTAPVTVSRIAGRLDELSHDHHRHDFYMLYWATEGTGHHLINYRSYEMRPGRVFFILAGQVHQVSTYAEQGWLILLDKMLYQDFLKQNGMEAQTGLFDHCNLLPYIDLEQEPLCRFNSLAALMEQEQDMSLISHYLSILLIKANKQYLAGKEAQFFHPHAVTIRKLKTLIEANFKTERLTGFYAKALGLPARKLNEITMQATGKLTMDLVCDRLLAESESLLASTHIQVKNIAYELGFIDQSHFANYFRKQKGMNPKAFRGLLQGRTGKCA